MEKFSKTLYQIVERNFWNLEDQAVGIGISSRFGNIATATLFNLPCGSRDYNPALTCSIPSFSHICPRAVVASSCGSYVWWS